LQFAIQMRKPPNIYRDMNKLEIVEKIKEKMPNQEQLIGWIRSLPGSSTKMNPDTPKVGDVLMHPVFKHPYVLLEKREDEWLCGLMTSKEDCLEMLCETQSRFFNGFFSKALFTVTDPSKQFINMYDNKKHLKTVLKQLKHTFNH